MTGRTNAGISGYAKYSDFIGNNARSVETVGMPIVPYYFCRSQPYMLSAIIGHGTITIGGSAFELCALLTSVILPSTLATIETAAFNGCSALTTIALPASVTTVGATAFNGTTALANVTVGSGFNATLKIAACSTMTRDTINAIIANYADASGKTLTLHSAVFALLTGEDLAAASAKGLTVASA